VVQSGTGEAVADCRSDERFAATIAEGTGYVPHTMLVVPLMRGERPIGALSLLDRRDGRAYREDDIEPAQLFASLTVKSLEVAPSTYTSLGMTGLRGAQG
jgi:Nif-specific regulatory protein